MSNPQENWKKIQTETPVYIPTSDGKGIAETIMVTVDAWEDESGEIFFDGNTLKKLDDIKARHMGLMSPDHIASLRELLDVTQAELSELLKIGEKTWTRWENGRSRPTQSMNILLHALWDGRVDLNYLRFMSKPQERMKVSIQLFHRKNNPPQKVIPFTYRVGPETSGLIPEKAA